jgi:GNAT superfamily N-acetyltransferase
MNLTIMKADPAAADELTRVAHAAKKHWGYPDEWIALWQDALTITPEAINSRNFYVGRNEVAVVFLYSIRPVSATTYELEDCWMSPDYIGQGYGRILFQHLTGTLRSLGCERLRIVSDPHAEGFYRKMGAVRIGEQPSKPEGRMLPVLLYAVDSKELLA